MDKYIRCKIVHYLLASVLTQGLFSLHVKAVVKALLKSIKNGHAELRLSRKCTLNGAFVFCTATSITELQVNIHGVVERNLKCSSFPLAPYYLNSLLLTAWERGKTVSDMPCWQLLKNDLHREVEKKPKKFEKMCNTTKSTFNVYLFFCQIPIRSAPLGSLPHT